MILSLLGVTRSLNDVNNDATSLTHSLAFSSLPLLSSLSYALIHYYVVAIASYTMPMLYYVYTE